MVAMAPNAPFGSHVTMFGLTDDATLIFLLRHGATDNNLARPPKLQGRSVDLGLSQTGVDQARRAARFLQRFPLAAVFASPLRRSQETAQPIAELQQLPVQIIDDITEVDVGEWEGRSWIDIEREESDAYGRFIADPGRYGYRGGENLQQVRDRAIPAIERAAQQYCGRAIAIVAHNVVNRCFLSSILHVPLAKARAVTQDNGGINVVRYRAANWKLVTLNHLFHLEQAEVPEAPPVRNVSERGARR